MYVINTTGIDLGVRLVSVTNCDGDGYASTGYEPVDGFTNELLSGAGVSGDFYLLVEVRAIPPVPGEFEQVFSTCDCIGVGTDILDYGAITVTWQFNSALQCAVIKIEPV